MTKCPFCDFTPILICLQAFRYMSHKFHGRGSGKKKTEKRMKKLQEEHVSIYFNHVTSCCTPLPLQQVAFSVQVKTFNKK